MAHFVVITRAKDSVVVDDRRKHCCKHAPFNVRLYAFPSSTVVMRKMGFDMAIPLETTAEIAVYVSGPDEVIRESRMEFQGSSPVVVCLKRSRRLIPRPPCISSVVVMVGICE